MSPAPTPRTSDPHGTTPAPVGPVFHRCVRDCQLDYMPIASSHRGSANDWARKERATERKCMRKCRRMKLKRGWGRVLRCGLFQSPIPLQRQICWGGTHESPTQRKLRRMRKVPSEGGLETDSSKATPSVHQAHNSRACLLTIASHYFHAHCSCPALTHNPHTRQTAAFTTHLVSLACSRRFLHCAGLSHFYAASRPACCHRCCSLESKLRSWKSLSLNLNSNNSTAFYLFWNGLARTPLWSG